MADREYTIERLKKALSTVKCWCRTDDLNDPISEMERAMEDAVEMMETPVPVKKSLSGTGVWYKDCGACGGVLPRRAVFCPTCGRAVKWDD